MRFEAGDVVRVPFPYVETNVRRYRPAVVVTSEPVGPDGLLIWAAMITNAERQRWSGDVAIDDLKSAGLPIPSIIRTAKIATLESESAERIGRLSDATLQSAREQIARHLGLA
jgi:mRNA interferase MazF